MKQFLIIIALTGILQVCSCGFIGPAALPESTKKKVTKEDIVGVWKYDADYQKTTITLELKVDGSFIQTIQHSGKTKLQIHSGKWDLEGVTPKLNLLKPNFGDNSNPWVLEDAQWWIVDSNQQGIKFAISGAADDRDPDSCFEMEKLR